MKLVLCIAFLTRPGSWWPCRGVHCPPGAATRWWHRWTPGPNRQHCLGSTWVILSRLSPYQEGYNFQVIEEFVTGRQLTALCSRAGSQQMLGLLTAKPFGPPNGSGIWLSSSVSEGHRGGGSPAQTQKAAHTVCSLGIFTTPNVPWEGGTASLPGAEGTLLGTLVLSPGPWGCHQRGPTAPCSDTRVQASHQMAPATLAGWWL